MGSQSREFTTPLYNPPLPAQTKTVTMEAERLNQLASLLSDLEARSAELRRYL
jgi:hypothetical protein